MVQDFAFHAGFPKVPDSQFLQPVEVTLDGGKFSGISATLPSFVLSGRLAKSTFCLYPDHE